MYVISDQRFALEAVSFASVHISIVFDSDCECDPGASLPGTFCNNVTGTCECLPHIYGKQCKK